MTALGRRLQRAAALLYESNVLSIAKGAAYSGLVALFPILTMTATLLVQWRASPVLGVLNRYLARVLPPGADTIVLDQIAVEGDKPIGLLITAILLAIWAGTGFQLSLMEGFNSVYRVPSRSFLNQRAVATLLVFTTTMPMVGASALIVFGDRTEATLIRWMQNLPETTPLTVGVLWIGGITRLVIAVSSVVLVTGLLYYIGPNRRVDWHSVWPGAWLATLLWTLATAGFAWYVRNIADYNVMYGSIGAVIALLAWMYLLAIIACYGCAFNAAAVTRQRPAA
ncbi:MAG: YihY/virulence factor BrkB family protein [Bryobacteraceae bacterium]